MEKGAKEALVAIGGLETSVAVLLLTAAAWAFLAGHPIIAALASSRVVKMKW